MNNFASKNLTAGELNALVKKAGGEDKVRKVLSGELRIQLVSATTETIVGSDSQLMTVLPGLSFVERIVRGRYAWVHSDLTMSEFPVTLDQYGEWEWELFHPNLSIFHEDVIQRIREYGFDPAQIGHLLTFGEMYPEEQEKYPIIALGSVARTGMGRSVPGLWCDRKLSLDWYGDSWDESCRFLCVRRRLAP